MPRPWARDGDRDADRDGDGGDPPSEDEAAGAGDAPFPTLDLPWPDDDLATGGWLSPDGRGDAGAAGADGDVGEAGEAGEDGEAGAGVEGAGWLPGPGLGYGPGLGSSWSEPAPCRGPRRQVRPLHRRRSRHSFEPEDLSDADLDRLLRGWSSGVRAGAAGGRAGGATGGLPTAALSWSAWTKLALAAGVLLVVVGVVGVITAAGDTRDVITRDTTRQTREPATTAPPPEPGDAPVPADRPGPPPTSSTSSPRSTVPPTTTAPPRATDPAPAPDPAPSPGRSSAAPLPESAADVAAAVVSCHPSYDPCVPIADDVDCADGEGDGPAYLDRTVDVTGPDVYGLDADHDDLACE